MDVRNSFGEQDAARDGQQVSRDANHRYNVNQLV